MTPQTIIQKAIPGADDGLVDRILFGRTAYPFVKLSARELWKAATRWDRAQKHGIVLCDFCNNKARENDWICSSCEKGLHTQMADDK